jgi:hypothetical protein
MNIATTVPLADTWGIEIGTGWVIAVVVMMVLCMGAMMFRIPVVVRPARKMHVPLPTWL